MNAKKPDRVLTDDLAGLDFVPPVGELFQTIEGLRGGFPIEQSAALEAGQGGCALHLRSPPHQHVRISSRERLNGSRRGLGDEKRHNRRSVPEFHRPSRRSSMSDSTPDALAGGGGVLKTAWGAPVRRGRNTPSRTSRDNLPLCPPSSRPVTGSSLATGRPRST